jgi:hypothetical protein
MATASSLVTVTSVQPTLVMRTSSRAALAGAPGEAGAQHALGQAAALDEGPLELP